METVRIDRERVGTSANRLRKVRVHLDYLEKQEEEKVEKICG